MFNWCLEGLRLYRKEGLIAPTAVRDATKDYQQSSDKRDNTMTSNNTTPNAWTPEAWKTFVHAVLDLSDYITPELVRQLLEEHGINYDKAAAESDLMTDEELLQPHPKITPLLPSLYRLRNGAVFS